MTLLTLKKPLLYFIHPGNIDEMMAVNLAGRVFQPHGLGHFMGMDVHDVGGYLEGHPERRQGPGLRNLRTARVLRVSIIFLISQVQIYSAFHLEVPFFLRSGSRISYYTIDIRDIRSIRYTFQNYILDPSAFEIPSSSIQAEKSLIFYAMQTQ